MTAILLSLLLILFSVTVHAIAKAYGDWVQFRPIGDDVSPFIREWESRDNVVLNGQGNPLTCGLWHYCEHVKLFAWVGMMLGSGLLALSLVSQFGIYDALIIWFTGFPLLGWFCYWWHGIPFTYLFHVRLMCDWTFSQWLKDRLSWE